MFDVFREVRERVSAQDAARLYGLQFDRRGWCKCPFHDDHHASMSFKNGRFRCWACNESGDAIDFTGKLLGLEPLAAVERLNDDFCLGLPLHKAPTPAETKAARRRQEIVESHRAFEAWRSDFIGQLNAAYRVAHLALLGIESPEDMDKLSQAKTMAIRWQPTFEYWSDTLSDGEPKEQMEIFRDRQVIQSRIDRILNHSPMKSGAA